MSRKKQGIHLKNYDLRCKINDIFRTEEANQRNEIRFSVFQGLQCQVDDSLTGKVGLDTLLVYAGDGKVMVIENRRCLTLATTLDPYTTYFCLASICL